MKIPVINYHFISDDPVKGLHACSYEQFESQVKYLSENYTIIGIEELIGHICHGKPLEVDNPAMITFDDGYRDHYAAALILKDHRIKKACFFVPAALFGMNGLLDVNKIQILTGRGDLEFMKHVIDERVSSISVELLGHYRSLLKAPTPYDNADGYYVKRMLQSILPAKMRKQLIQYFMITEGFTTDKKENRIAEKMYMDVEMVEKLQDLSKGFHVGAHSYSHPHLTDYGYNGQLFEISSCFFDPVKHLYSKPPVFCYPYGSYNETTEEILKKLGFEIAFGVNDDFIETSACDRFNLPRIDTNEFNRKIRNIG